MKICEIKLSLSEKEALDLRSLIESFFKMQRDSGIGEQSSRCILAAELLLKLPQKNITYSDITPKPTPKPAP